MFLWFRYNYYLHLFHYFPYFYLFLVTPYTVAGLFNMFISLWLPHSSLLIVLLHSGEVMSLIYLTKYYCLCHAVSYIHTYKMHTQYFNIFNVTLITPGAFPSASIFLIHFPCLNNSIWTCIFHQILGIVVRSYTFQSQSVFVEKLIVSIWQVALSGLCFGSLWDLS